MTGLSPARTAPCPAHKKMASTLIGLEPFIISSGKLGNEVETLNDKLSTLSEEELTQVTGGGWVYQDIEISLESENG